MNRARHWLEAERLQASGIARVNELAGMIADRRPWAPERVQEVRALAGLYFQAAQISASLAQAGPGLDAEVDAIQKERPPMPPPPPRPAPLGPSDTVAFLHRERGGSDDRE